MSSTTAEDARTTVSIDNMRDLNVHQSKARSLINNAFKECSDRKILFSDNAEEMQALDERETVIRRLNAQLSASIKNWETARAAVLAYETDEAQLSYDKAKQEFAAIVQTATNTLRIALSPFEAPTPTPEPPAAKEPKVTARPTPPAPEPTKATDEEPAWAKRFASTLSTHTKACDEQFDRLDKRLGGLFSAEAGKQLEEDVAELKKQMPSDEGRFLLETLVRLMREENISTEEFARRLARPGWLARMKSSLPEKRHYLLDRLADRPDDNEAVSKDDAPTPERR